MLRAYKDKSDIMSMSIGRSSGWPSMILSDVVGRLVKKGVVAVISAGNDGAEGLFYADSPASAPGGIAVASVRANGVPTFEATLSNGKKISYIAAVPVTPETAKIPIEFMPTSLDYCMYSATIKKQFDKVKAGSKLLILPYPSACRPTVVIAVVKQAGGKRVLFAVRCL
jgi:hypothetical protein